MRGGARRERELLDLLVREAHEARGERLHRVRALRADRPVLARDEALDLLFALHDHAQRRRLHAARGQAGLHLAPQHGREVEADEVVERTARLLRVHEVAGDAARVRDRLADRARRDFRERHAVELLAFEQAALLQDLRDVPGDRLAFAIQVGREVEGVGAARRACDRVDVALVLVDHFVAHLEAALGIDGALARHEVAHVAIRGEDGEVLPQVLVDRFRLRGRFDDEQVLGHGP